MAKGGSGSKKKGPSSDAAASSSSGGGSSELKTCNFVKARHILCEKQGRILEAYEKLKSEYLDLGQKVPPARFGDLAREYSECSSAKKGGDLGTFPRGKMEGKFQEVAFSTPKGEVSAPFKGKFGYHIILVEDRKA